MDLPLIWFGLLGVLLAGYAVLDGFDLGVGIIHPIHRDSSQRNVAIKAIGPLWDGNEVWLVTFGGALFAAFPEAYATILSAFYVPTMAMLAMLILRAVSVDFRNKVQSPVWKKFWDIGFFISSFGATLVFGIAIGNLIRGIELDAAGEFIGSTANLFSPYCLATGALAVATFALHGIVFLILKTSGQLRERLSNLIWHCWGLFLVVYILTSLLTLIEHPHVVANIKKSFWPMVIVIINVLAIANLPRVILAGRFGQAFVSSSINIVCLVLLFGFSTMPNLVTANQPSHSITLYDAASSSGTLELMLIIALIGMPLILSYTAIVYWTFRKPIEIESTN